MRIPIPPSSVETIVLMAEEKQSKNVKNGFRTLRARINGREMTLRKNRNIFM